MYIHTYVYIHTYTYIHTHTHIHTYIHTYIARTEGSQTQGNSEGLMFANGISLLNLRSCSLPREIKKYNKKNEIL